MKANEKKNGNTGRKPVNQYVQMSRKQLAGWLCAFMFLLVWIFILGIMVGRGTSPVRFDIDKLQKDLAELKAEVLKKEEMIFQSKPGALLKKENFELYREPDEAAALVKKEVVEKKVTVPKKKPVVQGKSKTIGPKPPAPGPKQETAEPTGRYAIQVAASREVAHAEKLVGQLKKKGYAAYRVAVKLPGKGTWHRVRVGRYRSREKALKMLATIKGSYQGAMVVQQ